MTDPSSSEPGSIFYDARAYADLDGGHAVATKIRRDDPVLRVEPGGLAPFWAVTRHAYVVEVERQHDKFWNTMDSVLDPSGGLEGPRATGSELAGEPEYTASTFVGGPPSESWSAIG